MGDGVVSHRSLTYSFEDFALELAQHRLLKKNIEIAVRPKTFQTLAYLVINHDRLISKQELLDVVWAETTVNEHAVAQCIREIRKVLADDVSDSRFIKTVHRIGYRFIAEVTELSPVPKDNQQDIPSTSSIAVLPFRDMSPEKDQEYFCEGIAEEIINTLTTVEGLRVVARTSAFSFKEKPADIREIGDKLNAQVVLEGSVRRSGDRLRIAVQLLHATSGYNVWSEQYDRKVDDVLAVQGEIAVKVVDTLNLGITGSKRSAALRHHTENLEAYHLYLRGRYFWSKENGEALQKAADYYERAIAIDPEYALAYAGLATCHFINWVWDYLPPVQTLVEGKRAALKALELDESLGAAHHALGLIRLVNDWNWQGAYRSLFRAIQLSPGDVHSHTGYAVYFMATGDMKQAIDEGKRALEIDPLSPQASFYLGMFLLRTNLPEQAINQFRETLELQPDQPQAHWLMGQALVLTSHHRKGIQEIETALRFSNQTPMILAGLGWAYGVCGRRQDASRVLQTLKNRLQREYIRPYLFAKIYCGMGDTEKAIAWLSKAYEERDSKLLFLKTDETFADLRSDARFSMLLRKMGLPETS